MSSKPFNGQEHRQTLLTGVGPDSEEEEYSVLPKGPSDIIKSS